MEGRIPIWMCLLLVLYICNLRNVNANIRQKFTINGNDLKKMKIINKYPDVLKSTSDNQQLRSSPCPLAEDIAPCICSVDENDDLSLNCDAVESEQQLAAVFQQHFPIKTFIEFRIYNNSNIEKLHDIFNEVTFEYIDLYYMDNLNFINDYFLFGSVDTLKGIRIYDAPNLTADYFPFLSMGLYSHLWTLDLQRVPIGFIPKILSESLTTLRFSSDDITSLEPGFLAGAPNVDYFDVSHNMISSLSNGTFAIPEQDTGIDMSHNSLQRIQPGALYFANEASLKSGSPVYYYFDDNNLVRLEAGLLKLRNGKIHISFSSNSIKVIEKGAFELPAIIDNLTIIIGLWNNDLTTIDESVFGELMPFVTYLTLYDNPLACGCDILWFISNSDYMRVLRGSETCADGKLVADLDVQQYIDLCS